MRGLTLNSEGSTTWILVDRSVCGSPYALIEVLDHELRHKRKRFDQNEVAVCEETIGDLKRLEHELRRAGRPSEELDLVFETTVIESVSALAVLQKAYNAAKLRGLDGEARSLERQLSRHRMAVGLPGFVPR
jgi:hypothetical protein